MLPGVLDHDEEQALAEIAANLRLEAPELHELFEADDHELVELLAHAEVGRPRRRWLRALAAVTTAVLAVAATTLLVGPDLGGLVGAVGLAVAAAYAYQEVRGWRCRHR